MFAESPAILDPPDPRLRACVVIPARNEAELLAGSLRALAVQCEPDGSPLDPKAWEILVLANNCTDETALLAHRFAARAEAGPRVFVLERDFPADLAHVGSARKWLMDLACARLEPLDPRRTLIASTDADSRVGRTWVAAQLGEVDAGADAVAGLIRVESADLLGLGPQVRAAYRRDRLYRRLKLQLEALIDPNPLDPRPGHDFHGGASLALTPATYRRVGGLPPLRSLEDVALVEALWLADARLVHSRRVRVATSARLVGRAEGGQSRDLTRWSGGPAQEVPDVAGLEASLTARRGLRRLFDEKRRRGAAGWRPTRDEVAELAGRLAVEADDLAYGVRRWGTFGEWLARVEDLRRDAPRASLAPIGEAIEQLRDRIKAHRSRLDAEITARIAPRGPSGTPPPPSSRG